MRLTLRTLLAYLDEILLPEDREDIGGKVRDSEFATALENRIRDVTQRPRLGAPQLVGTGMGRDPNSVAEYLDNTLAPEQVQLFEKVCLESDVHLAEVGSCHHICAMVLGEPAQVDTASRERMYRLVEATLDRETSAASAAASPVPAPAAPLRSAPGPADLVQDEVTRQNETQREPARTAAAVGPVVASGRGSVQPLAAETVDSSRRKPEVPSYLRESSRSRLWPIALTLLGAALATAVVIFVYDRPRVLRALGLNTEPDRGAIVVPDQPVKPDLTSKPEPAGDNRLAPPLPSGTPSDSGIGSKNKVAPPPAVGDVVPAGEPLSPPSIDLNTPKPAPAPSEVKPPGGETSAVVAPPAVVTPPPAVVPTPPVIAKTPGTEPPGNPLPGGATTGGPAPAGGTQVGPALAIPSPPVGTSAKPGNQLASIDAKLVPVAPVAVGRFLSKDHQVLLRSTGQSAPWERLPSGSAMKSGDRLLVLPTFRPKLSVSGVSLEIDGAAQIELGPVSAAGVPDISITFGRLIIQTLADPTARLHIRLGDVAGTLSFGDSDSTLALDVRPMHAPGTDPEKVAAPRQAVLIAASGRIGWMPDDGAMAKSDGQTTLTAKGRKTLSGPTAGAEDRVAQLPLWITAPEYSPLEQRASQGIEKALTPDRGVKLTLIEQSATQRVEVRNLATRCCAYIGHFEPLVKGLSDEEQRAGWMTYMSELHDAVARDPQTAAAVRGAFEQLRRDQAPPLYRMLWGYSSTGLSNGDARRLVAYLDHDELDFRVMAFWNLQELTGFGLNYRPEYSAVKRKPSIVRWQKRLEERKIAPTAAAAVPPATVPAPAALQDPGGSK